MADMNGSENICYFTYGLRTLGYKTRIEFIEYCIKAKSNTGLVIIDGIADLVGDVNDLQQANDCVQKLMEWSAKNNCHIICVIHSNFGSDKPTGHLGSFLEKKCETQIQLEANTVNKEWVTVRCKRSRGYAFDTFSFEVNDLGLPQIIGDLYDPLG
jgi:RecA-family ATPase